MHIAFVNPQGNFDPADSYWTEHPDFGGQLVYVKEVAMALARAGVRVDILTRRVRDAKWPEFADELDYYEDAPEGLRIVRIPCGGDSFLDKEKLWPHMEEWVAGIIAFYGTRFPDFFTGHYGDGGYAAALLKRATGICFSFTGHSLGAQKLDKLGMNPDNYATLEARFHFAKRIDAERASMRESYRIITSTDQERHEQYGHPLYHGAVNTDDDQRFAVIPPGVNTRIFNSEEEDADGDTHQRLTEKLPEIDRPRIIISSRLDDKKNIMGVVRAWCGSAALQEKARLALYVRGVDDPFNALTTLPEAEREVLAPILELIEEQGLRKSVDFINARSQQELAASYRFFAARASVFVLPSFYEPFGLAPIEAGACGLAVVATANGGPSEIFADGSGVLVDPADPADIAEGVLKALHDHERYAALVQQRVHSTYTWDRTAESYLVVASDGSVKKQDMQNANLKLGATDRLKDYVAGGTREALIKSFPRNLSRKATPDY